MQPGLTQLVTLAVAVGCVWSAARAEDIRFNRDIRPILSDTCFQCHGPDKAQRKAKLRLDVRDAALEKGAFVPGRPDESEMVKRLFSDDPEELMPPPELHKPLTPVQKDLLKRWIAAGAPYEAHWAYTPLERPPVPEVRSQKSEVRNPIDAFILAELGKAGLAPSPEADRRTLLRRLSLDLTGLPPMPAEVEAFVKDRSSKAYEKQVERLLKSPHYGERMAVSWLDAVRFADTVGYHGDQNQRIFPYRDWVIAAFNTNRPFDEFTVEQVAGDQLPNPTPDQLVGSGVNRQNNMTREGGAPPKEYLAKYQGDRVRTVSTAWLGATMACCECHDHKYDPFTTRDFYELAAFFGDVKQWGVYADYNYTPEPELRGIGNDHPFPPEIRVDSPYLAARKARLEAETAKLIGDHGVAVGKDKAKRAEFRAWRDETASFLAENPTGWRLAVGPAVISGEGTNAAPAQLAPQPDGSLLFASTNGSTDEMEVPLEAGWLAALRVELLPAAEHGGDLARGDRKEFTVELSARLQPAAGGDAKPVGIWWADADAKEPRFAGSHDVLGVQDGWRTAKARAAERQSAVWLLDQPFRAAAGDILVVKLKNNAAARLRLATSPFALEPARMAEESAALAQGLDKKSNRALLARLYLAGTRADADAMKQWRRLYREIAECRDGQAWTMITQATTNALVTRVLPRGNWMDDSGPVVQPATPHFLPPLRAAGAQVADTASGAREGKGDAAPAGADALLTRLDLAQWLVGPENPLTPRNLMNRLWAQFFGAGISGRVEDLGLQGEWPTHPELLDWLASEFRGSGWDMKHMVRLMVMSATYRQDAVPSAKALEADPANRLLSHQSPRRLDAEFVRDNALAIAGLINLDVGGPSIFPYQPAGYYANIQFPDRDYYASQDERQYRRGVYMHWQRTFLQPMLANFDAPSREECTAGRLLSNTPQQALTLLNDPTFVEAARVLAAGLLRDGKNDAERVGLAYHRALARPPASLERDGLLALLERQRGHYRGNEADTRALFANGLAPVPAGLDPAELAAWTQVCRVILNLHETITRY